MKLIDETFCPENEGSTKRRFFLIGFYCGFFMAVLMYFLLSAN